MGAKCEGRESQTRSYSTITRLTVSLQNGIVSLND